jgi:hypothetical protein
MDIGRVVGSNDQLDYLVQIYGPGDVEVPPRPADRAFGRFVQIPVGADLLIGIIYTTQLLNPAYGTLGPRLSTEQELPVFSPDYLAETATVVGVMIVGTAHQRGRSVEYDQGTPVLAPDVDAVVSVVPDSAVVAFHLPEGQLRLAYFPRLLARPSPTLPDLLCGILDRVAAATPTDRPRLDVIRQSIRWRSAVSSGSSGR